MFDANIEPNFDRLISELGEAGKSLLVEFDQREEYVKNWPVGDLATHIDTLIRNLGEKEASKQRPAQKQALREGGLQPNEVENLLKQIAQQERSRQGISEPTDG